MKGTEKTGKLKKKDGTRREDQGRDERGKKTISCTYTGHRNESAMDPHLQETHDLEVAGECEDAHIFFFLSSPLSHHSCAVSYLILITSR